MCKNTLICERKANRQLYITENEFQRFENKHYGRDREIEDLLLHIYSLRDRMSKIALNNVKTQDKLYTFH